MTKYALITGASSGIGYNIADQLADKGYKVFGCTLKQFVKDMEPLKAKGVVPIACDISDLDDVKRMAEFIKQNTPGENGTLHVLYNNAGIAAGGAAADHTDLDIKRVIDINLTGQIYVTKYLAYSVVAGKGTIVFTSSIAARVPLSWTAVYCASKAAVDQYAWVLHSEMKYLGVRVHSVITGGVDTQITQVDMPPMNDPLFPQKELQDSIEASKNMTKGTSILPQKYAKQVVKKITASRDPGFNLYHGFGAYLLHLLGRYAPVWVTEWAMAFHFKQLPVFRQYQRNVAAQQKAKAD